MKLFKFILPVIALFFSCSRDSDETTQNTRLELTVLDENNIAVSNAEVMLYPSQNDFENDTNMVQTLTTDANGKVTFENLQATTYYWDINSNCHTNNDITNSTTPIFSNTLNPFSIHLTNSGIGNVSVSNNTVENFEVFYEGPETGSFTINTNGLFSLSNLDVGEYSFTFVAVSGNTTLYYNVVVNCGETSTITVH